MFNQASIIEFLRSDFKIKKKYFKIMLINDRNTLTILKLVKILIIKKKKKKLSDESTTNNYNYCIAI